jgi:intermediate peptidase
MGEVNLDASIYKGMCRAEASSEFGTMPLEARTVLQHMRVSMEHEGIHLPDEEKVECLELLEKEQLLSFEIIQRQERIGRGDLGHARQPHGTWLPADTVCKAVGSSIANLERRYAADGEQQVLVPADSPWVEQILKGSLCPRARQSVYAVQQEPDQQGEQHMADLLGVRQRLARMRGYGTWNEYAQREALLQSPDRVACFIDAAWERLRPGFVAELKFLAAEKENLGLGRPVLEPWDLPLLISRCRQEQERHESDRISEYLTYGSLMKGVDLILSRLLGIAFEVEEPGRGEVWHPSVEKYSLRDRKSNRTLGILYLDPFRRPGKTVQSAQFTLQGSKQLKHGEAQIPVTTLVYALPAGSAGMPLSYAITFMHEIGHAVHSLLSETKFQHLSGTRGTVDFVEFPSHLFEHFVLDDACLTAYATHATTGASMPAELGRSFSRSRNKFAHFEAVQQLMYGVVDQAFYSCVPTAAGSGHNRGLEQHCDPSEVRTHVASVLERFDRELEGPVDQTITSLLGLSRTSKFDHLVHYGGSYYCYLFNRTLSAHVWHHGFKQDPFGPERGQRLRELLQGGSVVQNLGAIEALCPGAGGFQAEDVPFDALVAQISND